MAITTLDGLKAGLQPNHYLQKGAPTGNNAILRPRSFWSVTGYPAAGAFDTTLNGVTLTAPQTGQIPFSNPPSGNAYLNRFAANTAVPCAVMLLDRLWHNGNIDGTITTAQSITSPTWPARDMDGATDGKGVFLALEIESSTFSGTPTVTVEYINSTNTGGTRTANTVIPTVGSSAASVFYILDLQAGDIGVRSVSSVAFSTANWFTTGIVHLVAFRYLGWICGNINGYTDVSDVLSRGLVRVYNGTVPFMVVLPTSTSTALNLRADLNWSFG